MFFGSSVRTVLGCYDMGKQMRGSLIALTALTLWPVGSGVAAETAKSQETAAVMSVVNQFVDAFNKGDVKTAGTACAEQASIIDEFAPHEWHGAGACLKWMNDYNADAKKRNITDGVVTLGKARHVEVDGDAAYVVAPTDYVYKMGGKPVKETNSTLTVVLKKTASRWRITAWAWSEN